MPNKSTLHHKVGSGKYIYLSDKGKAVSIRPASWMSADGTFPGVKGGRVEWVPSTVIDSNLDNGISHHQSFAVRFPDGAESPTISIMDCILITRSTKDLSTNSDGDESMTYVSTARVGIPSAAMRTILSDNGITPKDNVVEHNNYHWLSVKVNNTCKNEPMQLRHSKLVFAKINQKRGTREQLTTGNWRHIIDRAAEQNRNLMGIMSFSIRNSAMTRTGTKDAKAVPRQIVSGLGSKTTADRKTELTLSMTLGSVCISGLTDINQPPVSVNQTLTTGNAEFDQDDDKYILDNILSKKSSICMDLDALDISDGTGRIASSRNSLGRSPHGLPVAASAHTSFDDEHDLGGDQNAYAEGEGYDDDDTMN